MHFASFKISSGIPLSGALMISCKTFAGALRRFAISESSFAESSAGKAHAMVESANSNVLTATKELPNILWMYFICCLVSGSISGPVVNIATAKAHNNSSAE